MQRRMLHGAKEDAAHRPVRVLGLACNSERIQLLEGRSCDTLQLGPRRVTLRGPRAEAHRWQLASAVPPLPHVSLPYLPDPPVKAAAPTPSLLLPLPMSLLHTPSVDNSDTLTVRRAKPESSRATPRLRTRGLSRGRPLQLPREGSWRATRAPGKEHVRTWPRNGTVAGACASWR